MLLFYHVFILEKILFSVYHKSERNYKRKKLNNNDYIALNNILLNSDMSRTELSHILEISPPAILKLSKITRENLVLETNEIMQVKGGRPRKLLLINKRIQAINWCLFRN